MTTRRLAAILAADVVGFSSMMEKDEEGTLARIKSLHQGIVRPAVEKYHGRVVKTTGDGILVEFASPVEAARCAIAIQDASSSDSLQLRIGINLGDIIIEPDGDVYGDGVNIATRLEGLADPGGVLVSGKVLDEIEGKIDRTFESRGEQTVKNITRPVRIYALRSPTSAGLSAVPKTLPLPDKPSIAVLPFTNMSGDSEQEYFADGMVEDILTALARIQWLFVIGRNSSLTYKGKAVDLKQVGRELGVRYVLEGSVRKAGNRVRLTAQLIEAANGTHIWADRYDRTMADVFELQDDLTASVVAAIEPSIRSAEIDRARRKAAPDLDAYDLYLRALAEMHIYSRESYRKAEEFLKAALQRDPSYGDALATLADCLGRTVIFGWTDDLENAKRWSYEFAQRAIVAAPQNGRVLALGAWASAVMGGNAEQGTEYADRALELSPNSAYVLTHSGWALVYNAETDRAIECFTRARRLEPLDPRRYTTITGMAAAHFFARRFDECIRITKRVVDEAPSVTVAWRFLAAAYASNGEVEQAQSAIADLLTIQPTSSITKSRMTTKYRFEWMTKLFCDGLRLAGLPE